MIDLEIETTSLSTNTLISAERCVIIEINVVRIKLINSFVQINTFAFH